MPGTMAKNRFLCKRLPGFNNNPRAPRLDPVRMRYADYRHLRHLWQFVNHFFDLAARHILTASLDHVLLAIDHEDVAVGINGGEIAGMEPAALEGGLGSLVIVKIAEHQVRRPVHDFTDLTGANVAHPTVHDACLNIKHGAAARTRLTKLIFRTEHGRQRRDLGLSV